MIQTLGIEVNEVILPRCTVSACSAAFTGTFARRVAGSISDSAKKSNNHFNEFGLKILWQKLLNYDKNQLLLS
jgi:hypothetical protein